MPTSLKKCVRLALITIASASAVSAAQAGYVQATAAEGSYPAVFSQNPGALAEAISPNKQPGGDASASATRLRVAAASDGAGAGPTGQYFHAATAANFTEYRLWDLDTNAAMVSSEARLLNLNFNFRLRSTLNVPIGSVGLDIGSLRYGAQVVGLNSALVSERYDGVSYAVGPPDSHTGNLGLLGAINLAFSLLHDDSDSGWLSMEYGNSSSNDVTAFGNLVLESVVASEDAANSSSRFSAMSSSSAQVLAGRNLGLRFDNGETLVFAQATPPGTPIPEPGTCLLVLLGLGLAARSQLSRNR